MLSGLFRGTWYKKRVNGEEENLSLPPSSRVIPLLGEMSRSDKRV